MSSSAAVWEYGQEAAGGGGSATAKEASFLLAGPRLSLDTSEGSDVRSVYGVPALAAEEAERAGPEESLSVNGEGGGRPVLLLVVVSFQFQLRGVWGGAMSSRDDKFAWVVASMGLMKKWG